MTDTTAEVPKDLADKVGALKALATTHNLLQEASFRSSFLPAVQDSLSFLKILHQQMQDECLAHPDCDKVEDLKKLKHLVEGAKHVEKK